MDDKPIYVTLEASVPIASNDQGTLLVRKVPDTYLSGTVVDLVKKVLDPEADSLNEEYNAAEREVANTVSGWFKEMNDDPANYQVSIMGLDEENKAIPMGLDSRVADYDSVIRYKEETDPNTGVGERYKLIDLLARRRVPGGNSLDGVVENCYEI